jgi:precorrin-6B methylase 2
MVLQATPNRSWGGCIGRGAATLLCVAVVAGLAHAQEVDQKPPFVTTPTEVVTHMLRMASTTNSDFVIDLGSGDGRIVIAAARQFGARGLGIELDGKLVIESRRNASAAGVAGRVEFVEGDVLVQDISRATVVTVYLLPWLMEKLQPRFLGELKPGTRIVSHAFTMPGWKPDRVDTVRITQRLQYHGESTRVFYWIVPSQVRGGWRASAANAGGDWRLRISQNYQELEIDGSVAGRPVTFTQPMLSGTAIEWRVQNQRYSGRVEGQRIVGEIVSGSARVPLTFERER